jgi:hypothetical protein
MKAPHYELFGAALLHCVDVCDPQITPSTRLSW